MFLLGLGKCPMISKVKMIKKLSRNIIKKLAAPCLAVTLLYAGGLGLSNLLNNKEYIDGEMRRISRARGLFGRITYYSTRDKAYKEIFKDEYFSGRGVICILDGGLCGKSDGLADRIRIFGNRFGINGVLYRDRDYNEFKDEFDRADRLLAKTEEGFEKYLK